MSDQSIVRPLIYTQRVPYRRVFPFPGPAFWYSSFAPSSFTHTGDDLVFDDALWGPRYAGLECHERRAAVDEHLRRHRGSRMCESAHGFGEWRSRQMPDEWRQRIRKTRRSTYRQYCPPLKTVWTYYDPRHFAEWLARNIKGECPLCGRFATVAREPLMPGACTRCSRPNLKLLRDADDQTMPDALRDAVVLAHTLRSIARRTLKHAA